MPRERKSITLSADKWKRFEARLDAAEYLLAKLYAHVFLNEQTPPAGRKAINDKLREMANGDDTVRFLPEQSVEFQCANEHDLLMMEEMVESVADQYVEKAERPAIGANSNVQVHLPQQTRDLYR